MTQKEAQQIFNTEYLKVQRETVFPAEHLPENYNTWKHAAFQFVSLAEMRQSNIGFTDYKTVLMKEQGFTYLEIFIINAALERRTVAEMTALIAENFYDVQESLIKLNKKWVEGLKPEEERIAKRIEIMSAQNGAYKEPPSLQYHRGGQA